MDPLQFAYRANRFVDDAVSMGLHYILQHLDRPGTYVRILFVDFSSAFNKIIPNLLLPKLTQLSVPTSICQWITSFLTDRQQLVKLGNYTSNTCTISTGAPQGCVLSPLLFSLYTNDCTSKDPSVKLMRRRLGFKSNFAYQHTKNTCIYTYKHSHIHINFHAYTPINTRTYIYTSKHSHIHINFHAYTPINTRTYI